MRALILFSILIGVFASKVFAADFKPRYPYEQSEESFLRYHHALIDVSIAIDQQMKRKKLPRQGRDDYFSAQLLLLIGPLLIPEAQAKLPDNQNVCLYGGWPSLRSRAGHCREPWVHNADSALQGFGSSYSRRHYCPTQGQFRCNPTLFGGGGDGLGVCVNVSVNSDISAECLRRNPQQVNQLFNRYRHDPQFRSEHQALSQQLMLFCRERPTYPACVQLYRDAVGDENLNCENCYTDKILEQNEVDRLNRDIQGVTQKIGAPTLAASSAENEDEGTSSNDGHDNERLEEIMSYGNRRPSDGGGAPDASGPRTGNYEPIEGAIAMMAGNPTGAKRGEPQTTWNECGQNPVSGNKSQNFQDGMITGYYVGTSGNCSSTRNISQDLIDFMNRNFAQCVNDSLSDQGISANVKSIVIGHRGITGDDNHSSRSLHAINRAIDLAKLHIQLDDGQTIERSADGRQNTEPHGSFYSSFRKCWNEKIIEDHPGQSCPGSEPKGSIGAENSNHTAHVHLSLPHCPSRGFYAK